MIENRVILAHLHVLLQQFLGWPGGTSEVIGLSLFSLFLLLAVGSAIAVGGVSFRRFDVARDRG